MAQPAENAVLDEEKLNAKKEGQREARTALIHRLRQERAEDLAKPLEACGLEYWLTCTHCGEEHETTTSCKKRWCPVCAPVLSAERHGRWRHAVGKLQWPLFLTLTLPNSEDPEQLLHLKKAWGRFRRRKIFADKVKGGVGSFEVTNKGQGWHPHLHAVIDCRWLAVHTPEPHSSDSADLVSLKCEHAQKELAAAWADCIGEPEAVVWVRRVYGDGVIDEILKYSVKAQQLLECPDPVAPMLRVIRQTRTLSGFVSLFPLPSPDQEQDVQTACKQCGEEKTLMPSELVTRLM